ncbi:MAG: PilZ domain-containing protein [Planctomycetota bacterium]|jgi:hypothetical protein
MEAMHREIEEFLAGASSRDFHERDRRDSTRLYHGKWPILVTFDSEQQHQEVSVSLENISETGLAFYLQEEVAVGRRVWVTLFSSEAIRPRLSAVVRHVTDTKSGYLVGCEFQPFV